MLFKHILLSSILANNRVIVIENSQKKFSITITITTKSCNYLQFCQLQL